MSVKDEAARLGVDARTGRKRADARRNRGLNEAGLPLNGTQKLATVPAQSHGERAVPPMPPRAPVAPRLAGAVDPTALPGNGARVVPRPAAEARAMATAPGESAESEEREGPGEAPPEGGAGTSERPDQLKQGEGSRGR